jgi:hypothetical protein
MEHSFFPFFHAYPGITMFGKAVLDIGTFILCQKSLMIRRVLNSNEYVNDSLCSSSSFMILQT